MPGRSSAMRYFIAQGMYSTTSECVTCRMQLRESGNPVDAPFRHRSVTGACSAFSYVFALLKWSQDLGTVHPSLTAFLSIQKWNCEIWFHLRITGVVSLRLINFSTGNPTGHYKLELEPLSSAEHHHRQRPA